MACALHAISMACVRPASGRFLDSISVTKPSCRNATAGVRCADLTRSKLIWSQAIEDMCREQLGQALRVYSQEVPLAQARNINGLRAVFGEVCMASQMPSRHANFAAIAAVQSH